MGNNAAQANIISNGSNGLLLAANSTIGSAGGANILLEATLTNANINIRPYGSSGVILVGNNAAQANIISNGSNGLLLAANSTVGSGGGANILIQGNSNNANINIDALGAGNVNIKAGSSGNVILSTANIVVGTGSAQANIISAGAHNLLIATGGDSSSNLVLATNSDVTSSNIVIPTGAGTLVINSKGNMELNSPGNIFLAPDAAYGNVYITTNTNGGQGIAVKSATGGVTGVSEILNIVKVSQSDYGNITTPDAETLYVIV